MPEVLGRGTTYNLPNYHGELFALTPADTPFLSMIGGLTGGKRATGITETEWQAYDLREAEARQRLEGADAPQSELRVRLNLGNVLEIHQETVDISYTKIAAVQMYAGANIGGAPNPVVDEVTWQLNQQIKTKALDVEHSFMNGRYHKPSDNTTARRTRGLVQAIENGVNGTANVKQMGTVLEDTAVTIANNRFTETAHGLADATQVAVIGGEQLGFDPRRPYYVVGTSANFFSLAATVGGSAITPIADGTADVVALAAVDAEDVLDLLQTVWQNGGIRESETATLFVGAAQKRMVTNEFITTAGYQEQTRSVGGVHVMTIETDFGRLNVALSRAVPQHALVVCSAEQCAPVILEIPGKGFLFVEPLGKKGASEQSQLYGEIGLEYGNPLAHGMLAGAAV